MHLRLSRSKDTKKLHAFITARSDMVSATLSQKQKYSETNSIRGEKNLQVSLQAKSNLTQVSAASRATSYQSAAACFAAEKWEKKGCSCRCCPSYGTALLTAAENT